MAAIIADYYVDPVTGADTNDGLTTTTPFATFQKGANMATAGQTVALKANGLTADEFPTTMLEFNINEGGSAGCIKYIGVNSSWEHDGSKYILDGSALTSIINIDKDRLVFHSIELRNAIGSPLDTASSTRGSLITWYNCVFRNNGNKVDFQQCGEVFIFACASIGNDGTGFAPSYYNKSFIAFCSSIGNTGSGISVSPNSSYTQTIIGCLCCDNGSTGIYAKYGTSLLLQNTCDGNGSYGVYSTDETTLIANRLTNNEGYGVGVGTLTVRGVSAFNFFSNNVVGVEMGEPCKLLGTDGLDTNIYTGIIGYSSPGSPDYDYNLTADATMRDIAITLPS